MKFKTREKFKSYSVIFAFVFSFSLISFAFSQGLGGIFPVWRVYKSYLIRCEDAINHPCGAIMTGTDPLSRGKVTIYSDGDVRVKIKGAAPEKTYNVSWAQINGGNYAAFPNSITFILIGQLTTDNDGDASEFFQNALSGYGISTGYIIISDGDKNQFTSGVSIP